MAAAGGPNIIDNGLVLYLDAASTKSFRGEPTENLVPTSGMRLCSEEFTRNSSHIESWTYSRETNIFGRANVTKITISPTGNNAQPYADWGFAAYKTGGSQIGDVYTVSFEFKVEEGDTRPNLNTTYANGYKTPNSSGAASLGTQYYEDLGDGWTRYSRTVTITTAGNTWWRFGMDSDNNNTTVYVDNFQIELKSYATRFVDGTRGTTVATGGGWADISSNDNHGEILNGTTTSNDESISGALDFDGVDDRVTIPTINLGNGNIPWTCSAWVKTTTNSTSLGGGSVLSNSSGGPVFSMMGVNNGKIVYWTYYSSAWQKKLGTGTTVNDGNWHLLTWVNYSNYTMDMYVDGYLDSNVANSTSGNNNPINIIGASWAASHSCNISQVSIYNRALTTSEIQQNYNATKGRYGL